MKQKVMRSIVIKTALIMACMLPGAIFGACLDGSEQCNEDISVNLTIVGTYAGFSAVPSIGSGYYFTGSNIYTATQNNLLTIGADDTSTFTLDGDLVNQVVGAGSGVYSKHVVVELTSGDGNKIVYTEFNKNGEPYLPPPLTLILDTTPPSQPDLLSPLLGEKVDEEPVLFQRSDSIDASSGLKEYILIVSNSPTMRNSYSFVTNQTSLLIDQKLIPHGFLYWTVRAVDNVGNQSTGTPGYFFAPNPGSQSSVNATFVKETDGFPEAQDENLELYPEEQLDDIFEEYVPKEHGLEDEPAFETNNDQKVTYLFQGKKKPSVLEVIKKKNHIQVLINQMEKDRHLVVTTEIINLLEEAEGGLVLPTYLFRTGADLDEISKHMMLLADYFPDPSVREHLIKVIRLISPNWRAGSILFVALLCYDIELYLHRYRRILSCNVGDKSKSDKKV